MTPTTPTDRGTKARALPPLAAALATLTNTGTAEPSYLFLEAWPRMPAAEAAILDGTADSLTAENVERFITVQLEQAVIRARAGWGDKKLPAALTLIDTIDPDYRGSLSVAIGAPAFWCGFALACYMMTTGNAEGAR